MELRAYKSADCPALAQLFYNTVHSISAQDYSAEQLNAWATGQVDLPAWNVSFLSHDTLVATKNGVIVGFGDMDDSGYLDRLYVHSAHQHKGVATALVAALEYAARARGITCFTTYASITAKPFFMARGYAVLHENTVVRQGVALLNYAMQKDGNAY